MQKRWLSWLWAGGWLLVVAVLVRAFLPKPPEVEVATVSVGPLQQTLEYTGKTRVHDRYTVAAPVAGHVSRITLHAGDAVTADTEVATLRPLKSGLLDARSQQEALALVAVAKDAHRQAVARAEAARKALEAAQVERARTQTLRQQGAATAEELERVDFETQRRAREAESAAFAAQVAAHEIERARALISPSVSTDGGASLPLYSPVEGVVLRVMAGSEGPVQTGTPLLEVGSLSGLEVVVEAQTQDAVGLKPGMKVALNDWGGPRPLKGLIRRVEPSAFKTVSPLGVEEQRVYVVIDFLSEKNERVGLGDGYEVSVQFVLWESPSVIRVPSAALFRQGSDWAVWVVERSKASLRRVETGHRGAAWVEVVKGLAQGEQVVLHPTEAVGEGRVRVMPSAAEAG